MKKYISGERNNRLASLRKVSGKRWLFRCTCGAEHEACFGNVRAGKVKSCGCLPRTQGGRSGTMMHGLWRSMIGRCESPTHHAYKSYGGRGVTVCAPWRRSLAALERDVGPRPSMRHTIDRIDNDGNYEPGNVRWATMEEQCNNKRNNVILDAFGERLTIRQWSRRTGIPHQTIGGRMRRGWPPEVALALRSNSRAPWQRRVHWQD